MVIECDDKAKVFAVLAKLERETDCKWVNGDKPLSQMILIEPMSWPIWLCIDNDSKIQWTEDKTCDGAITAEEFLASSYTFPKDEDANDPVNHPSHYTQGKVECIDAMEQVLGTEVVKGFCAGNTFKYLWRYEDKNGQEDIDKAVWYFNRLKQILNR